MFLHLVVVVVVVVLNLASPAIGRAAGAHLIKPPHARTRAPNRIRTAAKCAARVAAATGSGDKIGFR